MIIAPIGETLSQQRRAEPSPESRRSTISSLPSGNPRPLGQGRGYGRVCRATMARPAHRTTTDRGLAIRKQVRGITPVARHLPHNVAIDLMNFSILGSHSARHFQLPRPGLAANRWGVSDNPEYLTGRGLLLQSLS